MIDNPSAGCRRLADGRLPRRRIAMLKLIAACLVTVTLLADASAADPEDGIYSCAYDGTGAKVRRTDGAIVSLGKRLGLVAGATPIRSLRNDNSAFWLELKGVGPLAEDKSMPHFLAVVDGLYIAVSGHSERHADGTMDLFLQISGSVAAEKAAARLKTTVQRRNHPGRRIEVRWTPERETYHPGEAVTMVMELRNVGDAPFTFRVGGQQRATRDNQYRFLAYRSGGSGKAIPDTGSPVHFGGPTGTRALKPGEAYTAKVDLSKWFTFAEPNTYHITGLFELDLCDGNGGFVEPLWNDIAAGNGNVRVVAKEK
jgi:hypothetical protein